MFFFINIYCGGSKPSMSGDFRSQYYFEDSYFSELLLISIVVLSIYFFIKKTFNLTSILLIYLILLIAIFLILTLIHLTPTASKSSKSKNLNKSSHSSILKHY